MSNAKMDALKLLFGNVSPEMEKRFNSGCERAERAKQIRKNLFDTINNTDYTAGINWDEVRKETQIDNVSKSRTWF